MLSSIAKRVQTCIDINIEISDVAHYMWIFTSIIFRLALEITFLPNKYFFLQATYNLLSQSRKFNKQGGCDPPFRAGEGGEVEKFCEKLSGGGGAY